MLYTVTYIKKFESIQKQFLLFALRDIHDPRDYHNLPSYNIRLRLLGLQTLESRRTISSACFVFDILNENINVKYIFENVTINTNNRSRHSKYLIEKFHNTEYGRNEPITRSCRIFNEFINSYMSLTELSKTAYKNNLKELLM